MSYLYVPITESNFGTTSLVDIILAYRWTVGVSNLWVERSSTQVKFAVLQISLCCPSNPP